LRGRNAETNDVIGDREGVADWEKSGENGATGGVGRRLNLKKKSKKCVLEGKNPKRRSGEERSVSTKGQKFPATRQFKNWKSTGERMRS